MQPKSYFLLSTLPSFLLIAISFISSACATLTTKETSIKGFVIDQSYQAPVADIAVTVYQVQFEPISKDYIGKVPLETTYTDNQGRFSFNSELPKRSAYDYVVEVALDEKGYFEEGWNRGSFEPVTYRSEIVPGKSFGLAFQLASFGYCEFSAENNSPHDSLRFNLQIIGQYHEEPRLEANLNQLEIQTWYNYLRIPSGPTELRWHIIGDNIDTVISQYLEVIPFDTNQLHFVFKG
jgi:5-hydroxyisourate hydrolase-like protein (transthyretin family)